MPDLTRRGFFGGVLGAVAGSAVAASAPAAYPDQFEHRGCPIWWSGWRTPVNQDVETGWWIARTPPDEWGHDRLISTVGGAVERTAELWVIDTSYRPSWPTITSRSTPAEREAVKQRAGRALLEALDA